MIVALIPYFGGQSSAAPSSADLRPGYLARTVESLYPPFAFQILIGVVPGESTLPALSAAYCEVVELECEPRYLPATLLRWAQTNLPAEVDRVYVTEADQVLHYNPALLDVVDGRAYLVPHRLEQLGQDGEGSSRGMVVWYDGRRYVLPNGHPVSLDDRVYPAAGWAYRYGGAYLASRWLFDQVKFGNARMYPVESATGFAIQDYGVTFKTTDWCDFFVEHLSGYEYHQTLGGREAWGR